jgi:hypothetical protein
MDIEGFRDNDNSSHPGNRWQYLYGLNLVYPNQPGMESIRDGQDIDEIVFCPGFVFHKVDTGTLPSFEKLEEIIKFRKEEAPRIYRYFSKMTYAIEIDELVLANFIDHQRLKGEKYTQSNERTRMLRDGVSIQIFHLIKLQTPYFFNPIVSNLPLHVEQDSDSVMIDLIHEYSPTNQIDEPAIITGDELHWVARRMGVYGYFDQMDCVKNRDKLCRAFDTICNSIGIEDSRLRILNYWMAIETLLGFGDNLTVRLKQAIPLIENCNLTYDYTLDGKPYFSVQNLPDLDSGRLERQKEIEKLYRKRGKIAHGQFQSPYENQSSVDEWKKYHNEVSSIEEDSRIVLRNLIEGILSLGRIPSKGDYEQATVEGMLLRADHEECVKNSFNVPY